MDLKKIFSISGYPELYKYVANTKNGVLVESIVSKKRMVAFNYYRISSLEDIQVYTETGEIPLKEVFKRIYKKLEGKKIDIQMSDKEGIKKFIEEVLPEYDKERVKFSDMKRIIKWYNFLLDAGLVDDKDDEEEQKEKQEEQDKNPDEVAKENNDTETKDKE